MIHVINSVIIYSSYLTLNSAFVSAYYCYTYVMFVVSATWFCIHEKVSTSRAVSIDCRFVVAAPTGKDVAVRVIDADPIGFNLEFMPLEVGPHELRIIYGNNCPVCDPVIVMAFDSSCIRVMGVKDGLVGCLPSKFIGKFH